MKNLTYILMAGFIFTFVACSDDIEDATSKHVYGKNENPYLRTDVDAIVTTDMEFAVGHFEAQTVDLEDYAGKFEEEMGMNVDQVISGLENGTIVFYNIFVSKSRWNKAERTKGSAGWYYNSAGGVTDDSESYMVSLEIDTNAKALIVNVNEQAAAGTVLAFHVGFAVDGPDYDNYVRFSFNVSVTDPSIIITSVTIPDGDYASAGIDFNQYAETIQICMGMTVQKFLANLDHNGDTGEETGKSIHMYVVNPTTKEWDASSSYTAEAPGYWLNAQGTVCNWGDAGYSLYANTKNGDQVLYIGRAPDLSVGTTFTLSIGYKDTMNENNFFRFIIAITLE
jgi:ribosomal protein L21E